MHCFTTVNSIFAGISSACLASWCEYARKQCLQSRCIAQRAASACRSMIRLLNSSSERGSSCPLPWLTARGHCKQHTSSIRWSTAGAYYLAVAIQRVAILCYMLVYAQHQHLQKAHSQTASHYEQHRVSSLYVSMSLTLPLLVPPYELSEGRARPDLSALCLHIQHAQKTLCDGAAHTRSKRL